MRHSILAFIFIGSLTVSWLGASARAELSYENFPVDSVLRPRVDFWKKVYTQISSHEAYLHDDEDLSIVYETVQYPNYARRAVRKLIQARKNTLRDRLLSIFHKSKKGLTQEESALLFLIKDPSLPEVRRMAYGIRQQQGMADHYYKGLVRSQVFLERFRAIFEEMGLPKELAYLPHVESSFNYLAYSKVGAAGVWQFMRSTARLYRLKTSYVIDERRDPILATYAAARLLRDNYDKLHTWPLALTAYNHGAASMERAVRNVGSREMSRIISAYGGRRFGFASKNFYASFMAVAEISEKPERYFENIPRSSAADYVEFRLGKSMTISQISKTTGIDPDTLMKHNLAIRPSAFRSPIYIPADYRLRVPTAHAAKLPQYQKAIAAAESAGGAEIKAGASHTVAGGESLFEIARLYGVGMNDIIIMNEITNPSRIRPGMRLKIPGRETLVMAQRKPVPVAPAPIMAQTAPPTAVQAVAPGEQSIAQERAEFKKDLTAAAKEVKQELEAEVPTRVREQRPWYATVAGWFGGGSTPRAENGETAAPAPSPSAAAATTAAAAGFDPGGYRLDTEPAGPGVYRVTVEIDETLGHLADWASARAQAIRDVNHLRFGQPIHPGQKLKLPLPETRLSEFNRQRLSYHAAMEEDFYAHFRLAESRDYTVRRGDSLEGIARRFRIPVWLLRKQQPEGVNLQLVARQKLKIPGVESLTAHTTPTESTEEEAPAEADTAAGSTGPSGPAAADTATDAAAPLGDNADETDQTE